MATLTGGSKATTTLTALQFAGPTGVRPSDADIAAIAVAIINDQDPPAIWPGAFSQMGLLYVPNRGVLALQPDDFVMVGPDGFPYLVPAIACAKTLTATGTANSTTTLTFAASVIALGWKVGGFVAGTNIPAATTITAISIDGKTVTISNAATGAGANTVTYGSFTHS